MALLKRHARTKGFFLDGRCPGETVTCARFSFVLKPEAPNRYMSSLMDMLGVVVTGLSYDDIVRLAQEDPETLIPELILGTLYFYRHSEDHESGADMSHFAEDYPNIFELPWPQNSWVKTERSDNISLEYPIEKVLLQCSEDILERMNEQVSWFQKEDNTVLCSIEQFFEIIRT